MDTAIMSGVAAARLDPREEHFRVPSLHPGLSLLMRYLPPTKDTAPLNRTVLYVHGV
jgi:hypothetical protein